MNIKTKTKPSLPQLVSLDQNPAPAALVSARRDLLETRRSILKKLSHRLRKGTCV
jgi:hypothetical protein